MTATLVERASSALESLLSRRNFITRSAFVGSALAVGAGLDLVLRPGTAYGAICQCGSAGCSCGSTCCDGFSEFCCSVNGGYNYCPSNTIMAGWWKADNSSYCDGPRYYMDCNAVCQCDDGCGDGWQFCDPGCDGVTCGCGANGCDSWLTGCFQFRYGQCNQDVSCLGRIVCRTVACIPPWEIDPTCTTAVAVDDGTAEQNAPCWTPVVAPAPDELDTSVGRFGAVTVAGTIHVYKRTVGGDLVEFVNDGQNGRLWNSYDLTVYGGGPSIAGDPAAMTLADVVHVYGRDSAGHLVEFVNDDGGGRLWNSYDITVYGGGPAIAGDPVPLIVDGVIHVYTRDTSDHLVEWVNDGANGRLWNSYDITVYGGGPTLSGNPAAADVGGVIHVYTRGSEGDLVEWVNDGANGRLWNSYDLTVYGGGPAIAGDPAPVIVEDVIHVYTADVNRHLVEWVDDGANGRLWNSYDLTVYGGGPAIAGDPAPILVGDVIHVYTQGSDGDLVEWVNDGENGRLWNSYDLTVYGGGPAIAGDAAPLVLDVVAHVYATAAGGDFVEFVNDGAGGRLWNSYDITVYGGGPEVSP